jgi:hypothetical protein
MGLDGGTFASRADVLRRASWNMATADSSRSTRGGSIPRGALVKTVESASHTNLMAIKWSTCTLTGEDLRPPIVACALGNLYNRQAVLEHLLGAVKGTTQKASTQQAQKQVKEAFSHLTSLSSVFDVTLTTDPALTAASGSAIPSMAAAMAGEAASGSAGTDCAAPRFACPIVHCLADGRNQFVAVRPCGCVVSARAMKHIQGSSVSGEGANACPVCNGLFTSILRLNGTAEQVDEMKQALQVATTEAKRKKKDEKREKKKKRRQQAKIAGDGLNVGTAGGGTGESGPAALMLPPPPKRPKLPAR